MDSTAFYALLSTYPIVRGPTDVVVVPPEAVTIPKPLAAFKAAPYGPARAEFMTKLETFLTERYGPAEVEAVLTQFDQVHAKMLSTLNLEDLEDVAGGVVKALSPPVTVPPPQ